MFDLLCFLGFGVGCVVVGLCCHEIGVVVRCDWGSVEKRKKKLFYNILIGYIVK
jgi:hypothetical protein